MKTVLEIKKDLLIAIDPAMDRIAFQHKRMEDDTVDSRDIVKETNHLLVILIDLLKIDRRKV